MKKKAKKKLTKDTKDHIVDNGVIVTDLVLEIFNLLRKKTKDMDTVQRLFIVHRTVFSLYAQTFRMSMRFGEEQLSKDTEP